MDLQPQLTILLIEDDIVERNNMIEYLASVDDIALVGSTGSAIEGLKLVAQLKPDVILLDLELLDGNGITFLEDMQLVRLNYNPFVFVTTRTRASVVRDAVEALGAQYFYCKNNPAYSAKAVIGIVKNLFKFTEKTIKPEPQPITEPAAPQNKERELRRTLTMALAHLSIPAGKDANAYFVDSILYVLPKMEKGEHMPDLKNEVFPVIAEKYGVKRDSIDRNLRYALESAWTRTDQTILDKHYPFPLASDRDCPSPKEFIFNLVTTLF